MMRRHIYARPQTYTYRWVDWFLIGLATVVLSIVAVAFAVVFLLVKPAGAHEANMGWQYDWVCCSDKDCDEISQDRVRTEPSGYVIDGRFHVPQTEVRFSPDGRYHACFPNPDNLRCFYAPPSGS